MRMTTEAGNDVSMSARLRRRVLQNPAQLRWLMFNKFFRYDDHLFQMS